jgi:2-polyprenyl-3-methyl-5-hydroxy-6-metoxy-1,4-benzoquinol methylase
MPRELVTRTLCPICNSPSQDLFIAQDENRRISSAAFNYRRCLECGTVFLQNIPADLSRYYQDEYYAIPTLARLQDIAQRDPTKIDTVKRYLTSGRLLEIGPAFGVFAYQARSAGFAVDVIEMDARCCEFLRSSVRVNAICSERPEDAMSSLAQHDVITLWHVFEHLPKPVALVEAAANNLVAGGTLIIAMPNVEAFQFRVMGRRWPHLDAPRHLSLLPAQQLTRLARQHGLELVALTTDDHDARGWNRFGWQRWLMNRFTSRPMQWTMFFLGYALSVVLAPMDRRPGRGSAYTAVFLKQSL